MEHELKCWPEFFRAIVSGIKPFEVRSNDRNYKVGDTLKLKEYNPPNRWIEQYEGDGFTGLVCRRRITFILDDPEYCKPGYVVMGLTSKLEE